MPASSIDRIRDPLSEKFLLSELSSVAPWVYEEITALDFESIEVALADHGGHIHEPQSMQTWVSALNSCHSDVWQALA